MNLDLSFFSPEEELHDKLFINKNIKVFIKRDDNIHPFISGNKWRKLKYNLLDAQSKGIHQLVTFGGAWSNHLIATAAAGAKFSFKTIGIVRGDEVENPCLSLCKVYGMKLIFISRTEYQSKREYFINNFNENSSYFIDEGGRSDLGIKGCSEMIDELKNTYSDIFTASGTGTTVAGFYKGVQNNNLKTKIHSIPVLKGAEFLYDDLKSWGIPNNKINIHLDYHFGGYAKIKTPLIQFIKSFVSKTGILIEPTYTGKMLYGFYDLVEKDYFPNGSNILLVHTGGLTGILGQLPHFNV